jgi:hypothetical protein
MLDGYLAIGLEFGDGRRRGKVGGQIEHRGNFKLRVYDGVARIH